MKSIFSRGRYFFNSALRTPLLRNPRIWLNFSSCKDFTLPQVSAPAAAYLPFVQTGKNVTADEGKAAARLIAIDLMGMLQAAVGDLGRVRHIVKKPEAARAATLSTGSFMDQGAMR